MTIDLDYSKASADWLKTWTIDIPEPGGGPLTEATFREWMRRNDITAAHLRALPLYSEVNRARFPWLEAVAEEGREMHGEPGDTGYRQKHPGGRSGVAGGTGKRRVAATEEEKRARRKARRERRKAAGKGPATGDTAPAREAYQAARFTDPLQVPAFQERAADERTVRGMVFASGDRFSLRADGELDSQDAALYDFATDQGFTGTPEVVSAADLDAHVAAGEVELFRGIGGRELAEKYAEDFRTGDYFAGQGMVGSGTYTSTSFDEGEGYAGPYGVVMRMTLRADARIITHEEAWDGMRAAQEQIEDESRAESDALFGLPALGDKEKRKLEAINERRRSLRDGVSNAGRWATLAGYDAIDVGSHGHYVILNRTALRVQSDSIAPR